jgi:hypothetical protein
MLRFLTYILLVAAIHSNVLPRDDVDKMPALPPSPEELGAPNIFGLAGLSENERTDIVLVEGDIAMPVKSHERNAFIQKPKWAGGVVPYELDRAYTAAEQNTIRAAMSAISSATGNCIKFVARGNNAAWLRIFPGQGCWSHMGRIVSSGAQEVSLQRPNCVSLRVSVHELLHALGFAHEQTRPDRDGYVRIYPENIQAGMAHNFDRYSTSQINTFSEAYDYGSIMHYANNAFSKNGKPTIRPSLAGYEGWEPQMGRGDKMSVQDIRKLKKYYGCP